MSIFLKSMSIFIRRDNGNTALHVSVEEGHVAMVQWLVENRHKEHRGMLTQRNYRGKTALELAKPHSIISDYLEKALQSQSSSPLFVANLPQVAAKQSLVPKSKQAAFMKPPTLSSSNSNHIGDAGVDVLVASLEGNHTLTSLSLGYKQIGSAEAQSLAESLKNNHTLTSLDLGHNKIGDAGAEVLAASLKGNRTLTKLYLSDNQIGDVGVQALAVSLKDNHALTSLDLAFNKIGATGAKALAASLKDNRSLISLDLEGNDIGAAGQRFWRQA